ncbi:MAG: putative oxidoreductase YtbE [Lentisphaerae bacterium ADurb.Bin242]|nr:MAG: putative oxidoreductase YtbE [Lentisphaerae bacterium ADurb.Bin242]
MIEKTLQCGFSIPALGMGTWRFGGGLEHDPDNDDEKQLNALREGLDAGFTRIDTAESYAAGYAEILIGKAIEGRKRDGLFLTSKVWKTNLTFDGVLRAAEGSLNRLGTDWLDLYLIHQVNEEIPLKETVRAMDRLADEKVVRAIGVSNFALERFQRAQAYADHKIVLNQVHYSLVVREPEKELLAWCQKNDVILEAWRPLRELKECELLLELARKYNRTTVQIALSWLLSQKNVVTLSASTSPSHLRENLAAADFSLTAEEIEKLRADYPFMLEVSPAVPLR